MSEESKNILDRVLNGLGYKKNHSVDLAEVKTADGQTTFDSENFAVGDAVFIVTEDGNIPVPVGEYILEDGLKIKVDETGIIVESEKEGETSVTPEEEQMQNDPMKEETGKPVAQTSGNPKAVIETMTKETQYMSSHIEEKIKALELKLSALETENMALKSSLNDEGNRTIYNPEQKNAVKTQFKIGSQREETIEDRVFKQLFS
jgi:hypothetical protein